MKNIITIIFIISYHLYINQRYLIFILLSNYFIIITSLCCHRFEVICILGRSIAIELLGLKDRSRCLLLLSSIRYLILEHPTLFPYSDICRVMTRGWNLYISSRFVLPLLHLWRLKMLELISWKISKAQEYVV